MHAMDGTNQYEDRQDRSRQRVRHPGISLSLALCLWLSVSGSLTLALPSLWLFISASLTLSLCLWLYLYLSRQDTRESRLCNSSRMRRMLRIAQHVSELRLLVDTVVTSLYNVSSIFLGPDIQASVCLWLSVSGSLSLHS